MYGFRGHFEDLYEAIKPVHRLEIKDMFHDDGNSEDKLAYYENIISGFNNQIDSKRISNAGLDVTVNNILNSSKDTRDLDVTLESQENSGKSIRQKNSETVGKNSDVESAQELTDPEKGSIYSSDSFKILDRESKKRGNSLLHNQIFKGTSRALGVFLHAGRKKTKVVWTNENKWVELE